MTLSEAIELSEKNNEIVKVDFDGTFQEMIAVLKDAHTGYTDWAEEADYSVGVWGWTADTPENDMDWRIRVTIVS